MTRRAITAIAALCLPSMASGKTLRDAVAVAYFTNPRLAAARARQEALAETPEQARAAGRLTAEADGTGGYSRFDYGKGGSGSVTASLPVWTGGRVSSAVRAASSDVAAGAEGVRDAEAAVLETVIGAYADLLFAQQAVAVARADIELLDNQVTEARARFKLGQATRTDVAQIEAQRGGCGIDARRRTTSRSEVWVVQRRPAGTRREGEWHVGLGCAVGTYPYCRLPGGVARLTVRRDDTASVAVSGHEMGMGTATVHTQVLADRLGLAPEQVTVEYGRSMLPGMFIAGGVQQTAAISGAIIAARRVLVAALLELSGNDSPLAGAVAEEVEGVAAA